MSTLQIGLAIAGGIVLVGVVAHSTWTSRRNKPRQAQPLSAPEASAEAALSTEPHLDAAAPVEPVLHADGAGFAVGSEVAAAPGADLIPTERRPSLDALIDVIAPLELESPVSGDAALQALPTTRRVGTKMFLIEGLHADTAEWEPPRAGQRYSAFQAGVQLANRMGPLNEIEFSEFVLKTQQFADAINAAPEFPDMMEEVARGRELDSFASAHDAQLSFNLKATQAAWSPGYVQQNAARLGFVPGVIPGRLVVPAATAGLPPILGLSFDSQAAMADDPTQSAIWSLTLQLDVPQVDRQEEPFARMIQTALELGRVMDGAVTDDHGRPLTEEAIAAIARDLMSLYDTLDARDLSAGSPQARRLFS